MVCINTIVQLHHVQCYDLVASVHIATGKKIHVFTQII
jgi:hypothetical protein